jgi:hypothetical protein
MSLRDENVSAGIMVALFSLVMFVALLGALFLPPGIVSALFGSKWIFFATLFAIVVVVPILLRLAQRSRIRDAVEELGGTIVRAKRLPFWRQDRWPGSYTATAYGRTWWRGLLYEVEFLDPLGVLHHAVCRSGFLRGVQWLGELPT